MQANRWQKTPPTNSSWIRRCMKLEGQLDELVQAHVYYNEVACVFVCICLCFLCLLCHSWALESVGTEAKQNGVARLKAVLGPAASVFNHRFTPNQTHPPTPITLLTPTLPYLLTPLHADQAAVKEAMHPATPTHTQAPTVLSSFLLLLSFLPPQMLIVLLAASSWHCAGFTLVHFTFLCCFFCDQPSKTFLGVKIKCWFVLFGTINSVSPVFIQPFSFMLSAVFLS